MADNKEVSGLSNLGDRQPLNYQKPKVSQSAEADRPKIHSHSLN